MYTDRTDINNNDLFKEFKLVGCERDEEFRISGTKFLKKNTIYCVVNPAKLMEIRNKFSEIRQNGGGAFKDCYFESIALAGESSGSYGVYIGNVPENVMGYFKNKERVFGGYCVVS